MLLRMPLLQCSKSVPRGRFPSSFGRVSKGWLTAQSRCWAANSCGVRTSITLAPSLSRRCATSGSTGRFHFPSMRATPSYIHDRAQKCVAMTMACSTSRQPPTAKAAKGQPSRNSVPAATFMIAADRQASRRCNGLGGSGAAPNSRPHDMVVQQVHRMRRGQEKRPDPQAGHAEEHPRLLGDQPVERDQCTDKRGESQTPFHLRELLRGELLVTLLHQTAVLKRQLACV